VAPRLHVVRAKGAAEAGKALPGTKDTAMGNFVEFAEVAGAIIAAFGLALGLEWVSLYGLTSMVPLRRHEARDDRR